MPPAARDLLLATATPDDTRALGAAIAATLRPGDVLSLTGELGAGKTCFVQGAARGLGVIDRVTSPSFVLRRDYRGRHPIVHLDVYRLETLREVEDLGYEDVLAPTHVTFIEWGDAMSPLLPADYLEVELSLEDLPPEDLPPEDLPPEEPPPGSAASGAPGDVPLQEPRRIVVRPHGADWARRLTDLAADLSPWRRHEEES